MVCIFFVISGVALTLRPAQLIREGDWDTLYKRLESMVFQRGIRLFGPCLVASLSFMLAAASGLCDIQSAVEYEGPPEVLDEFWEKHPQAMESFWSQLGDWFEFLFTKSSYPRYGAEPQQEETLGIPMTERLSMALSCGLLLLSIGHLPCCL